MNQHYSIDLETLGTRYDSYILSIGVAAFDISTGEITKEFHAKTICDDTFHIDVDTVMWWVNQDDDARQAITDRKDTVPIVNALIDLSVFMEDISKSIVWGNGSSFDITLLDHAYHKCQLVQPWKFWNVRDMRTIVSLAQTVGFSKKDTPFEGTAHDALADARHQAKVISKAHQLINHLGAPF